MADTLVGINAGNTNPHMRTGVRSITYATPVLPVLGIHHRTTRISSGLSRPLPGQFCCTLWVTLPENNVTLRMVYES